MRPPAGFFGEQAIFNDRTVARTYGTTAQKFGGVLFDAKGAGAFVDGPILLQPAGCLADDGTRWISAKGQADAFAYVVRETGLVVPIGAPVGARTIIRAAPSGKVRAAFADTASSYRVVEIDPTGLITAIGSGAIPDGGGGNGMLEWDADGNAVPVTGDPDRILAGLRLRKPVTAGGATIGAFVGDPGQVVLIRSGQAGTLALGGADFIRISDDGECWCGVRYVGEVMLDGEIPDVVPPLQQTPPAPPVTIPAFTYPVIVAPFKAWNDRADYGRTDVPTNGIVQDTIDIASIPPRANGQPKFILGDTLPSVVPTSQLIGHFDSLEGGVTDEVTLEAFVAQIAPKKADCIARQRPLVLNLDGNHWPESTAFLAKACAPELGLEIVPMVELYPFRINGQIADDDTIVAEWRRNLSFLAPRFARLAVAVSTYTQSDNYPVETIVRLFPQAIALAVEFRVFLICPFSIGRPSGVLSYPDQMWPLIHALAAACVQGDPSLDAVLPAPSPVPVPVPRPAPLPDEDFMPALPFRCYALSHLSTPMVVNFDAPGPKKLDLHYPTIGFGAYQEVEVAASKATPGKVTVRFVGANQFVRVDRGDLAKNPATLERALSIWDAARDDADTEWQHGELVGSYVHYYGDGPNGLHGVLYTLTLVDGDGKLFM